MNKIVPTVLLALAVSTLSVWYFATKAPQARNADAQTNILIVGTNSDYAPFSFMKDDALVGFDIDLITEIAKRLHKDLELVDMPFDALIPAMQVGSIEMIAAGITPTPERQKNMIFTKPYLTSDQLVIVSPASKPLATIAELTGKNVAVNEGFTADYYMANINGPVLMRLATLIESFLALQSRQADALVSTRNAIQPFIEKFGTNAFNVTPIEGATDTYALAISKHNPELLEPVQKALDEMDTDGALAKLKTKWNLQ